MSMRGLILSLGRRQALFLTYNRPFQEEEVRKIKKRREEVGVQLYGVQHQLAKMQTTFERTHDNYNIVQKYRIDADKQLEILQKQYE